MITKHTPTPYSYSGIAGDDYICSKAGRSHVCRVIGRTPEEIAATKQFIVRACNAHEELLSACKAIVEALDDPDNGKDRDFMAAVDWKQVRAAIARAEGKE